MTALLVLIPVGLALGVFMNYLSDVLPVKPVETAPRCASCGAKVDWPVYLRLQACPGCGKKRAARAWLVPLASAVLLSWLWFFPPSHLTFWQAAVVLVYFGLVVIMDIEHRIILHKLNLAGAVIGLWIGLSRRYWVATLAGGLVGFGAMLLFYYAGIWYARWLTRRRGLVVEDDEALGFGDVNLGGVIGLLVGWPAVTAALLVGILSAGLIGGGIVLTAVLAKRYNALASIPYGPFLVFGALFILLPPW